MVEDFLRDAGFAVVDAYRYNSASLRVRVVDPRFEGLSADERFALVEVHLARLPGRTQADIVSLLLITPSQLDRPKNKEFEAGVLEYRETYCEFNTLECPHCGKTYDVESEDAAVMVAGGTYDCPECGWAIHVVSAEYALNLVLATLPEALHPEIAAVSDRCLHCGGTDRIEEVATTKGLVVRLCPACLRQYEDTGAREPSTVPADEPAPPVAIDPLP